MCRCNEWGLASGCTKNTAGWGRHGHSDFPIDPVVRHYSNDTAVATGDPETAFDINRESVWYAMDIEFKELALVVMKVGFGTTSPLKPGYCLLSCQRFECV